MEQTPHQGPPHESLSFVLAYLPLYDLLVMSKVCRSLREAVRNDTLLWQKIEVGQPLSNRFTDDHLVKVASKSDGRLRTLALFNCFKITDHGLLQVVSSNLYISTLFVPMCSALTPGGVIEAVKLLHNNKRVLKRLMIHGIRDIKKEDLVTLRDLLGGENHLQLKMKRSNFYHTFNSRKSLIGVESSRALDVETCPKCDEARVVFDCPRDFCRKKMEEKRVECRGCSICIARCEECGVCTKDEEEEETACGDTVCLNCWLQLPKCSFCNKPYCSQHSSEQWLLPGGIGWICTACRIKFTSYNWSVTNLSASTVIL